MFIIKVRNGIGNQLFIYAFGEYLKKYYPSEEIKYDFSDLPYYVNGRYTRCFTDIVDDAKVLEPFEVRKHLGKSLYYHRLKSNDRNFLHRIERKIVNSIVFKKEYNLVEEPSNVDELNSFFLETKMIDELKQNNDCVFDGFWEDIRYVEPVKAQIRNKVTFRNTAINKRYEELVTEGETVAVHIRRKDYIKESFDSNYPKYFYAFCDEEYYKEAINIISKNVSNPVFLFFSDDVEYAKKTFYYLPNKEFIENQTDIEDLFLMTQCKHHIIANSTFSFWGAFLSNKGGITVAPNIHYIYAVDNCNTTTKIYFQIPQWRYIDVSDRASIIGV